MLMYGVALARTAGRVALNLVLPPRCLTCDAGVEAPGRLCAACFRITAFVTEPCCHRCGRPFGHAGQGGVAGECGQCATWPPAWREARAALRYDEQAKRMILPLKYGDRVELAVALAGHMARAGVSLLRDADVLVPVPLHRRRLLRRRYNQSALLAWAIGRAHGLAVLPDAIRRVRATESLAGKTRQERQATVEGAFMLRPGRAQAIAGRGVLLIDDVLTTGATAAACTAVLMAGGAAHVDLLVAARVEYAPADGSLP